MLDSIPVIVGPTAVGKSTVAEILAETLDADILSCDSRQVFRGMSIGTAAPDATALSRIAHHFIAERDPTEPWSAGQFKRDAEERIRNVHERHRHIVIVGGSTLYVSALVNGIAKTPAVPPSVRAMLNNQLQEQGVNTLYEKLLRVDPAYAASLDSSKSQRIVRGLEVYAATGKTLSSFQQDHEPPSFRYNVFVLYRERTALYAAINARVDAMFEAGLLDEVAKLAARGFTESDPVMRTIGYQEVFPVLRSERTLDEAVLLVKQSSRRYAKRQLTWLRRLQNTEWLDMDVHSPSDVVDHIVRSTTNND